MKKKPKHGSKISPLKNLNAVGHSKKILAEYDAYSGVAGLSIDLSTTFAPIFAT